MWKRIALGLILTLIILWLYIKLAGVDVNAFWRVPPEAVAAAAALLFLSDLVRAFRLKLIAKSVGAELSAREAYLIWEASRLLAVLTPGFYGGEVLRIGLIARKYKVEKAVAINVLETTSEAVAIGVNAAAAFSLLLIGNFGVRLDPLIFPVLLGVAQALLATLVPALRCPGVLKGRALEACRRVQEAISLAGYGAFAVAVLASTVGVVLYVMSFGVIASALDRLGTVGTLVLASSLPLTIIPLTPGGIGLPESACTLAYPKLANSLALWRIVTITTTVAVSTASISLLGLGKPSAPSLLPRGPQARGTRPFPRGAPSAP
ncbi:MAG: flippase-like domain-containing protein [Crenarchaeota archaeon]|nr:flippase-like domain-containing protein [Thermoproteota archaeon]